ncbi:MAG: glycosyltransferase family 2 protein [Candidatus Omnitrophica bacterium]|nr:glycosyltransferase family 2 protein [Candidatus Omnitrophota bacterium]
MNTMKRVSVVIPVYNEVQNIEPLYRKLQELARTTPSVSEFLFVDDGSTDGTWQALVSLRERDAHARAIRLRRNFGQTAAMACGIDHARGEVIVTMDGDLQNDPSDIPRLVAKLDEGFDVVSGWRYRRQDRLWTRRIPSTVANRLIGLLTGVKVHDYGCSLKAYRAEVIRQTPLYAELHRFIPALSTMTGALIGELKVAHHARTFGQTKYNLWRTWKVALDMVTVSVLLKFALRPLRFFGFVALGVLVPAGIALARAWQGFVVPSSPGPVVLAGAACLGLWLAGHLLIVGCVAELCRATAHADPQRSLVPEGA